MAFLLCGRFLLVNSCSFSLHPFQLLSHPTPSSPNYPINFSKITNLSLLHRNQLRSSSSMEAAPEGYRRNVGICLINPSKKVIYNSHTHYVCLYMDIRIWVWTFSLMWCVWMVQIFAASRLDVPDSWQMPQVILENSDWLIACLIEIRTCVCILLSGDATANHCLMFFE